MYEIWEFLTICISLKQIKALKLVSLKHVSRIFQYLPIQAGHSAEFCHGSIGLGLRHVLHIAIKITWDVLENEK